MSSYGSRQITMFSEMYQRAKALSDQQLPTPELDFWKKQIEIKCLNQEVKNALLSLLNEGKVSTEQKNLILQEGPKSNLFIDPIQLEYNSRHREGNPLDISGLPFAAEGTTSRNTSDGRRR